jgi:hypothetical protein
MDTQTILEMEWPYLLSFLPPGIDLEAMARDCGALRRKRAVDSASSLLRLAFAYSLCELSLRDTCAWAEAAEVASLSNVALLKRLRECPRWLGQLLGLKLAERASPPPAKGQNIHLRLVDATCISKPGSKGTDWRVHLGYDLASRRIDHIELTDAGGGEKLSRFRVKRGEIVVGDRGYAHRRGLYSVIRSRGDFLVRTNWQNLPLELENGKPFDLVGTLRKLPDATVGEVCVRTTSDPKGKIPALPARFVAVRKTEAAAQEARRKVLKERSRKGRTVDPRTLEAAGYVMVVTSVSPRLLSAPDVLEVYRFRWQIEMAFKRLKSLLHLGNLPAKDPPLARTILYTKLLAALLLDDFTERFLAFSPWGFPIH